MQAYSICWTVKNGQHVTGTKWRLPQGFTISHAEVNHQMTRRILSSSFIGVYCAVSLSQLTTQNTNLFNLVGLSRRFICVTIKLINFEIFVCWNKLCSKTNQVDVAMSTSNYCQEIISFCRFVKKASNSNGIRSFCASPYCKKFYSKPWMNSI